MDNENGSPIPRYQPTATSEEIKQYMQANSQRRKDRKWLRRCVSITAGILIFVAFVFAMGPFLNNARALASRAMSMTNLNGIGKALMLYRSANDDKFPTNLELLITQGYSSTKMFTNPVYQDSDELKMVDGKFQGNMGYVFFLDIPEDAPEDTIIGYEKGEHELLDYLYALTLNGSVAKLTPEELNIKLKSQGRPIVDFKLENKSGK